MMTLVSTCLRNSKIMALMGGVVILGAVMPAIAAEKSYAGSAPEGAAMPVRYSEGALHGFLLLSTLEGVTVAHGELLQAAREGDVKGRTVFRYKDGSYSEETTEFSQRGVFSLKSYRQIQRGPAFEKDVDYKIERVSPKSGRYQVTLKNREDGKVEKFEDRFEMPADLYNGLVMAVAKNIPEGGGRTIHVLALTPKPRLIEVQIRPVGTEKLARGGFQEKAIHYVLDPDLGGLLGRAVKVMGKGPPSQNLWMASGETPGFMKFEGPQYRGGPVMRITRGTCFPGAKSCAD